jgi:chromate transport protein ChrA
MDRTGLFRGLQVMVVAILADATFLFGRDSAKKRGDLFLATVSAALFWAGVSPRAGCEPAAGFFYMKGLMSALLILPRGLSPLSGPPPA